MKSTLMATVIASVAGTEVVCRLVADTLASISMIATFILAVAAYAAVKLWWPSRIAR